MGRIGAMMSEAEDSVGPCVHDEIQSNGMGDPMITLERQVDEEATLDDVRGARDRALQKLGITYAELEQRARDGLLRSRRERIIWLTYRDLGV